MGGLDFCKWEAHLDKLQDVLGRMRLPTRQAGVEAENEQLDLLAGRSDKGGITKSREELCHRCSKLQESHMTLMHSFDTVPCTRGPR